LPSFINIAKRVKGIATIEVIISIVRTDVGSIGKPHIGKNGIGNKISSQIPTSNTHFLLIIGKEPL
jgi:hypothetical protein